MAGEGQGARRVKENGPRVKVNLNGVTSFSMCVLWKPRPSTLSGDCCVSNSSLEFMILSNCCGVSRCLPRAGDAECLDCSTVPASVPGFQSEAVGSLLFASLVVRVNP